MLSNYASQVFFDHREALSPGAVLRHTLPVDEWRRWCDAQLARLDRDTAHSVKPSETTT